jgi:tRNA1(Val) A37 N6-methylase TrmN6
MSAETLATSDDAVLGGRLALRQPRRGHRVGHDAILLAAATAAHAGDHAIDLGAGVGGAGLALARRVEGVTVTLVEIDPALAALAADNAKRNGLSDRVNALCLDVESTAAIAAAGVVPGTAAHVLMNPPFNVVQQPSPDRARRLAHAASAQTLARWLHTAAWLLRPDGVVTLIWRADALADVLSALDKDFGAVAVLPVHPKPGAAAIRVLVRASKGSSRAARAMLPGLLLAGADGKPTAAAEAVLRDAKALSMTGN